MNTDKKTSQAIVVAEHQTEVLPPQNASGVLKKFSTIIDTYKTSHKSKDFDMLRYRYKDNEVMLVMTGPKENQDKIIARLKEFVEKYEKKNQSRKKPAKKYSEMTSSSVDFVRGLFGK
jgi:hypothetical protein